jgi:peptidoglycan/LPS O-acetylase OafA/YrhL
MQHATGDGAGRAGDQDHFRPDIEGLRGLAVMLVVVFHAGLLSRSDIQLRGGFISLDLFFVVSGFLITGLLIRERERTGRISFSRFYARRVRRILPAAAAVLLVTIPVSYSLVALVDRPAVMEDAASSALSIANIRFALTTDYFNPVSFSPFLHFWSLGVEEQFYFVWPALMAVVAWRRPRLGAAVALGTIVVIGFLASVVVTRDNPAAAYYMLPTRAWQLAAGGILAIGAGSLDRLPGRYRRLAERSLAALGWTALVGLLLAAVVIDFRTTPYPGSWALVPTLAGVLLIASGTQRFGPGLLLRSMPIRFLGKISYSLYLWHWPVLILGGLWLRGPLSDSLTLAQALALAGLSIPIATLSWAFIEEPFRRGRVPLPRPSRVVAGGMAAMLVVAMVGVGLGTSSRTSLLTLSGPARTTEGPGPGTSIRSDPYAVTSAIRPPVAKAAKDRDASASGCLADQLTTQPPRDCIFGHLDGSYTAALVGDSHAAALFPAVNAVALAHGWRLILLVKAGCPFIDLPVFGSQLKREFTECASWNSNVISALAGYSPDLVIVSILRWLEPMNPASANVADEGRALARMIGRMPSASRKVIIEDVPLPSKDVPACLSANLDDYRRCAYSREVGFGANMGEREQIAAAATGARVMDLTADICPGTGDCPVVIDNMIAYRDATHLTATFAASLGPSLDRKLAAILATHQPSRQPADSRPARTAPTARALPVV